VTGTGERFHSLAPVLRAVLSLKRYGVQTRGEGANTSLTSNRESDGPWFLSLSDYRAVIEKGPELMAANALKSKETKKPSRRRAQTPGINKPAQTTPESRRVQSTTFVMRLDSQFKDWLDQLADHCRLNKAVVIDQALAAYAEAKNFPRPPRRIA
jgi:hypothetical protein